MLHVLDRGGRGHDRQPVHVVDVLDQVERRDQLGISESKADPHPGQRVRLRHRAQDEQVVVAAQQVEPGLGREIDVGLVQDHHAGGGGDDRLDHAAGMPGPRRRVGVDDELEGRRVGPQRIGQGPVRAHPVRAQLAFVDCRDRLQERVSGRGEGHPVPGAGEGPEAHLDQLVGAVAEHDHFGREAEVAGDRLPGGRRARARIEAQPVAGRGLDGLDDPRRGPYRRLVGVELDPVLVIGRLVARAVGLEPGQRPPQEAFLHSRRKHSRASRGLTFCSR